MQRVKVIDQIVDNIGKVIIGKEKETRLILVTLLCQGHVLIEDVPGVGKTSLASALAKSLQCSFNRIQFTPDIMPADITGFSIFNQKTGDFEFRPGSIQSQIVLADEINRTSPKTQSSLLEAMEERQVTVDGETHALELPFMVLATQNPVEYIGTYPLPEAQMDRFFMQISLGYPSQEEELTMLARHQQKSPLTTLTPVASAQEILELQELVKQVYVDPYISEYIVEIVRHTRQHPHVELGASPRGSIALYKASQAWALMNQRSYVIPDDVIRMSSHVLEHRIIISQEGKLQNVTQRQVARAAVQSAPIPRMKQ